MSDMIVGLDIGTSNVRCVIGEYDENDKLQITGVGTAPSTGLRSGVIVNIEATMRAVTTAIEAAEMMSGREVKACYAGIGGTQIDSLNSSGFVVVTNKNNTSREINDDDIERVIKAGKAVHIPLDREILHVVPQMYTVDSVQKTKDPRNMIGVRLEVDVHIVTATITTVQNVFKCASRAGYSIDGVMLKTLASVQSVLTEEEKELGSILIDMGGGSTDVIVVADGAPICTDSVPFGGILVTNDISVVRGIATDVAEKIKITSGCCWEPLLSNFEEVLIGGVGGKPPESVPRTEICRIIQPRVQEIFEMIRAKIYSKVHNRRLSGNVVLVGGGARMSGVIELASSVFGTQAVRIGIPGNYGGISDAYRFPDFSTATGLVVANQESAVNGNGKTSEREHSSKKGGFWESFKNFFKEFF